MESKIKRPIQIALADDDPDDRELFGETIKETAPQSKLSMFEDGQQLLTYLETCNGNPPDVIFLDINMPYVSGKESLKQIRSNAQFNHIPIVMFSTSTNENDVYDTFKFGANLFITKPGSYLEQVDVFHRFF